MSLEWRTVELKSIANVIMGQSPKSEFYNDNFEGMPFLQGNKTFGDKYPSFELYTTSIKKVAEKNSVLMSVRAPVGDLNIAQEDICIGRGVCGLQMKKGDNEFLYYLLKANISHLINKESGTVFGSINKNDIETFEITLPESHENQMKILSILKNIDKKIEVCKNLNKNLEELMHVLFKKYFIDNNPFYVENDEKWNIIKLKDLIIRNRDKINDFDNWKDELLIDLSNMPRFSIAISNFDKGKKFTSNIYKLNKYDLLFGSIRPYFGKVGFSPINGVVTGTVHSFKPIDDIYYSLVLSLISSKTFINYTVSVSKGTKMPSVKWDDFINYEFAIPDDLSKIGEYNKILLPLIHKIEKNILEIQRLTKLRDTLLPKLMSGEIDVSKINCDLKIIIRKIYIKSSKLFLWRYLSENKNYIKNTKSNETLLKSRTIYKINKFLAKFNARYRYYRQ